MVYPEVVYELQTSRAGMRRELARCLGRMAICYTEDNSMMECYVKNPGANEWRKDGVSNEMTAWKAIHERRLKSGP